MGVFWWWFGSLAMASISHLCRDLYTWESSLVMSSEQSTSWILGGPTASSLLYWWGHMGSPRDPLCFSITQLKSCSSAPRLFKLKSLSVSSLYVFVLYQTRTLLSNFSFWAWGWSMEGWMFHSYCRMLRMNFGVTTLCVGGGSFSLWAGIASNGNGNIHPRFQTEVLISWVCVSHHVCCWSLDLHPCRCSSFSRLQHPGSGHGCCSTCVGCLCGKLSGGHFFKKPCYNSGFAFCPPSRLA